MKMKLLLIFYCCMISYSYSQTNKQLVKAFYSYSQAKNTGNQKSYLSLISDRALAEKEVKKHVLTRIENISTFNKQTDDQNRLKIDVIKKISKPIVIQNTEYVFIDYIDVSHFKFTQKFLEKALKNKTSGPLQHRVKNESYWLEVQHHSIVFDIENKSLLETRHEGVLAIKEKDTTNWKFIPRWCFDIKTNLEKNTLLKKRLPNKIVRRIQKNNGYDTKVNSYSEVMQLNQLILK